MIAMCTSHDFGVLPDNCLATLGSQVAINDMNAKLQIAMSTSDEAVDASKLLSCDLVTVSITYQKLDNSPCSPEAANQS